MNAPAALADPASLADLLAQWVESLNPEAEIRYRHALCREAYDRGLSAGHDAGYAEAIADVKAAEHGIYRIIKDNHDVSERKWHLCCPSCRLTGCHPNCPRCESRTAETFAGPRDDDYTGGPVSAR